MSSGLAISDSSIWWTSGAFFESIMSAIDQFLPEMARTGLIHSRIEEARKLGFYMGYVMFIRDAAPSDLQDLAIAVASVEEHLLAAGAEGLPEHDVAARELADVQRFLRLLYEDPRLGGAPRSGGTPAQA